MFGVEYVGGEYFMSKIPYKGNALKLLLLLLQSFPLVLVTVHYL